MTNREKFIEDFHREPDTELGPFECPLDVRDCDFFNMDFVPDGSGAVIGCTCSKWWEEKWNG